MVSTATFAALDEVWKDDDGPSSLLPQNPYKNDDYQRKVLTGTELGTPAHDTKRQVQKYLQQLYEEEGAGAVDSLIPKTSSTKKRRGNKKKCAARHQMVKQVLEEADDDDEEEDEEEDYIVPSAPQIGPDFIFFIVLAIFVSWWILSSDPADFK